MKKIVNILSAVVLLMFAVNCFAQSSVNEPVPTPPIVEESAPVPSGGGGGGSSSVSGETAFPIGISSLPTQNLDEFIAYAFEQATKGTISVDSEQIIYGSQNKTWAEVRRGDDEPDGFNLPNRLIREEIKFPVTGGNDPVRIYSYLYGDINDSEKGHQPLFSSYLQVVLTRIIGKAEEIWVLPTGTELKFWLNPDGLIIGAPGIGNVEIRERDERGNFVDSYYLQIVRDQRGNSLGFRLPAYFASKNGEAILTYWVNNQSFTQVIDLKTGKPTETFQVRVGAVNLSPSFEGVKDFTDPSNIDIFPETDISPLVRVLMSQDRIVRIGAGETMIGPYARKIFVKKSGEIFWKEYQGYNEISGIPNPQIPLLKGVNYIRFGWGENSKFNRVNRYGPPRPPQPPSPPTVGEGKG